jgi:hypothetical protein
VTSATPTITTWMAPSLEMADCLTAVTAAVTPSSEKEESIYDPLSLVALDHPFMCALALRVKEVRMYKCCVHPHPGLSIYQMHQVDARGITRISYVVRTHTSQTALVVPSPPSSCSITQTNRMHGTLFAEGHLYPIWWPYIGYIF